MGIYIRGMEMPTDHPMWIVVHSDGTVEANEVSQSRPVGWQTLRNAAVPVPPHGRLIDADALEKDIDEYIGGEETRSRFHHWVQVQRTVIPESKEART